MMQSVDEQSVRDTCILTIKYPKTATIYSIIERRDYSNESMSNYCFPVRVIFTLDVCVHM